MTSLDSRLHAFRPDIADERLRGRVSAERYVPGHAARVRVSVADLRSAPRAGSGLSTQLKMGEDVAVFDYADGFAWVQSASDGYVGYVAEADLAAPGVALTHKICVPRTFVYPGPDLRFAHVGQRSMGDRVQVSASAETRGTRYAMLATGEAIIENHLCPIDLIADDYVTIAESFLNTPYLWGGVSGFGIDCSGLVQLSMHMAGHDVLRDTDMQASSIGIPLDPGSELETLRRGDFVFWEGHVAIVTDPQTIVHASGHTMLVSREGLRAAIDRIGYLYGRPTGFRRPQAR